MTNLEPRSFQIDFFHDIAQLESKNIVIVAGRGIGKTLSLAVVALWYVLVLSITESRPMKVVILAGSLKQAQICFHFIMEIINKVPYLQHQLVKVTQDELIFNDGSWIRPLPASEKTVRGHHPDLLIIDEAAQVENDLLFAAMPMTSTSPYSRRIYSTTPSTGFSFVEEKWENQARLAYPEWKFWNWNAESFCSPNEIATLKAALPPDRYHQEIQGLPYKREGKVFRLQDIKECQEDKIREVQNDDFVKYAGVDWGYYPAPTVITIVQKRDDQWYVLYTQPFLEEYPGDVLDKIVKICIDYRITTVFTDSTDKGENLRLSAQGLPVTPVSFKGEKPIMITNLRTLMEQKKIHFDPVEQQNLIGQLLNYYYESKRNDDYVDSLMLAVHENPMVSSGTDLLELLKAGLPVTGSSSSPSSDEHVTRASSVLASSARKERREQT